MKPEDKRYYVDRIEGDFAVTGLNGVFSFLVQYADGSINVFTYTFEDAQPQQRQKQDKHNSLIERTYRLEGRMTEAEHDIRDLKGAK